MIMFKPGFVLSTDAHIMAAMLNQTPVTVWMGGKIVDYGGVIEEFNGLSVKINGEWHSVVIRDGGNEIRPCEFRIR
jgi:hypothetical protein